MYKLLLAWRYLISRRIIYFSVVGIAVGVMALIVVTSVMGGFIKEIKIAIRGTSSDLIVTKGDGYFITDYEDIAEEIKKVTGVSAVSPRMEWVALLDRKDEIDQNILFVRIIGIDAAAEVATTNFAEHLSHPRPPYFPPKDENNGIPAAIPAFNLFPSRWNDHGLGQTISLTTLKMNEMVPTPIKQEFILSKIFYPSMYDPINTIYLPLEEVQHLLGITGASKICVKLNDYRNAGSVKQEISRILEKEPEMYIVNTWEDEKANILRAVAVEKRIQTILLFFIVIVAIFSMVAMLTMRVMEKTRDIGILKALGSPARGIMSLFLIQGFIISIIGCVLGLISGILVTTNLNQIEDLLYKIFGFRFFPRDIYYLTKIPDEVDFSSAIFIIIITIVLSLMASIIPALKAANLDPVESLRYE